MTMDSAIGSLRAAPPVITEKRPMPVQVAAKPADRAAEGLGSDKVRTQAKGGALRPLKVVAETLFPGAVAPGIIVSGTITLGLAALSKMPKRQSAISAGSYAASMVAGNLAYRAVHAVNGSHSTGRMAASLTGTAIGLGEAALLKRPASLITLISNSIAAGFGASEAAKSIQKNKQ
jgi:hypothetical protein